VSGTEWSYTEMSFLGSTGHLMKGSGIEDVLQLIYVSNTVGHIMSGKAVSRAVRGHFIVDASLHSLLAAKVLGITLPAGNSDAHQTTQGEDEDTVDDAAAHAEPVTTSATQIHDVQDLTDIMHKLLSGTTSIGNVEQNELLLNTMDKVTAETRNPVFC